MNRRALAALLAVLAIPAALALAQEAEPAWRAKLEAFERTGEAERKKLGLDRDEAREALYARYPTPEVTFGGPVVVCPGATATVRLQGQVPQGALVFARGDGLEVVGGKRTAGGWEGAVRASPGAAPGPAQLVVVAPVSLAQETAGSLAVGCKHTWTLDVGGDALVVRTEFGAESNATATGEWRRGGKALGSMRYRASAGPGSLALQQEQTAETAQEQMGGFQKAMASKEWKDVDARTNVQMTKLQECGKLPPEKMAACFAGPQQELEKLNVERQAMIARAEKEGAPSFGCRNVHLRVRGARVEGQADGCAGRRTHDEVQVTGRYTAP